MVYHKIWIMIERERDILLIVIDALKSRTIQELEIQKLLYAKDM